jgi:hypothetical protein
VEVKLALPILAATVSLLAACSKPLPEQGTHAERLYAERCGTCHRLYPPHSMTFAMWQIQMAAMQLKIVAAGEAPLTLDQEQEILDYLQRNAGGQ